MGLLFSSVFLFFFAAQNELADMQSQVVDSTLSSMSRCDTVPIQLRYTRCNRSAQAETHVDFLFPSSKYSNFLALCERFFKEYWQRSY